MPSTLPPANEFKHGVIAILQNKKEEYLFIRRGLTIERAPGFWCFVGGQVESNETLGCAIEREVSEEVGLQVKALEKIHESFSPNNIYQLHWMRVQIIDTQEKVTPHAIEVEDFKWLTASEGLRLTPSLPTLIDWLQKNAMS